MPASTRITSLRSCLAVIPLALLPTVSGLPWYAGWTNFYHPPSPSQIEVKPSNLSNTTIAPNPIPGPANLSAPIIPITTPNNGPSITFANVSPLPICYKVEISFGTVHPTNETCDQSPGFIVPEGENLTVSITPDFAGAITAILAQGNPNPKGARHEFNFRGDPGTVWYDIDYQYGFSNSTIAPFDDRVRSNGLASIQGESNILAKVNEAWNTDIPNRAELLKRYYYLEQDDATGNLTAVRMDEKAPMSVVNFYQMAANLSGYVDSGSVVGVRVLADSMEAAVDKKADGFSYVVDTQRLVVVAYP